MLSTIVGMLIYLLWLALPFITVRWLIGKPDTFWRFTLTFAIPALISVPAYIMIFFWLIGWVWPLDVFMPGRAAQSSIFLAEYQVEYIQEIDHFVEYKTYFEITRLVDGAKAYMMVDDNDDKCWTFTQTQVESRIYILCGSETISDRTSYVDLGQQYIYGRFSQYGSYLQDLTFSKTE